MCYNVPRLAYRKGGILVADVQQDSVTFEEVQSLAERYMDHPFLRTNQLHQNLSRFHFDVIQVILQMAHVTDGRARQILCAVLLLHQGLSIHDTVDGESGVKRQLTVLAGDYDSGRYYWLLARLEDQGLLTHLCRAVVTVNEAKMTLFKSGETLAPEAYLRLHEMVQGELVLAVATHYLGSREEAIVSLRSLVRAFVINEQVFMRRLPGQVSIRQAISWMTESVEKLLRMRTNYLLEPIVGFVIEYIRPLQNAIERLAWAEGIQ